MQLEGHKKEHVFCPGHNASHIRHKAYCGFANIQSLSQGVGTQAKPSNATKHMPTQFQL